MPDLAFDSDQDFDSHRLDAALEEFRRTMPPVVPPGFGAVRSTVRRRRRARVAMVAAVVVAVALPAAVFAPQVLGGSTPGPVAPGPRADLSVSVAEPLDFHQATDRWRAGVLRLTVHNGGPDRVASVVTGQLPLRVYLDNAEHINSWQWDAESGRMTFVMELRPLAAGQSSTFEVFVPTPAGPDDVSDVVPTLTISTPEGVDDPDLTNNTVTFEITFD